MEWHNGATLESPTGILCSGFHVFDLPAHSFSDWCINLHRMWKWAAQIGHCPLPDLPSQVEQKCRQPLAAELNLLHLPASDSEQIKNSKAEGIAGLSCSVVSCLTSQSHCVLTVSLFLYTSFILFPVHSRFNWT